VPDALLDFLSSGLFSPSLLLLGLWLLLSIELTILTVTLYLHRSQAHRAVDFHPALAHVFRFWNWLSTGMVVREWVAVHRKHHARCETEEDPHSPAIHGMPRVLWHGVSLYQRAKREPGLLSKYGRGAPEDRLERWLYGRRSSIGPALYLLIEFLAFGVPGIAIWALQMLAIPVLAAGVVNGLGHGVGYRNFETEDRSTNLLPLGLFLGGEELHNNHHAFPTSARFALRRGEIDLGYLILRGLQRLGLANILREAPQVGERAGITSPDQETLRALLIDRFGVMSRYFREVTLPTLRQELASRGGRLRALPRRMRRALASGPHWLDAANRERFRLWLSECPLTARCVEYRQRLRLLIARGSADAEALRLALRDWMREAEASGIEALARFASRLAALSPVPLRASGG
jgi:stearoyl-CoA desaturase (delta-9 desaturase)